jgi:hypothetical protein
MKIFRNHFFLAAVLMGALFLLIIAGYGLSLAASGPLLAPYFQQQGSGEAAPGVPEWVDGFGAQGAFDPMTPDIRFDFPPGAISVLGEIKAFRSVLPEGVPPPPSGIVGSPFFFGTWIRGEGRTVDAFARSIVITVGYDDAALSQAWPADKAVQSAAHATGSGLPLLRAWPWTMIAYPAATILLPPASQPGAHSLPPLADEGTLRLTMYDPTTRSWVKLCSRVDPYANKVSAALLVPTPLTEGDNTLFAMTPDDTPSLEQVVDAQGSTTLSIPGSNFHLRVAPGTVEVGTHFEFTGLRGAPDTDVFRLLPMPFDIKACRADYTTANNIAQIARFPKPLTVEFGYDAATASRAGGRTNLTVVGLRGRRWADLEELGLRVARGTGAVSVDIADLGSFGLAVR